MQNLSAIKNQYTPSDNTINTLGKVAFFGTLGFVGGYFVVIYTVGDVVFSSPHCPQNDMYCAAYNLLITGGRYFIGATTLAGATYGALDAPQNRTPLMRAAFHFKDMAFNFFSKTPPAQVAKDTLDESSTPKME